MIGEIAIVGLLALNVFQEINSRKERKKLIEAIMAKDLKEYREPEQLDKRTYVDPKPDYTNLEEASDEDFDKAISKTLGRETVLEKAKEKLSHGR